jgi:hypothetical protein
MQCNAMRIVDSESKLDTLVLHQLSFFARDDVNLAVKSDPYF